MGYNLAINLLIAVTAVISHYHEALHRSDRLSSTAWQIMVRIWSNMISWGDKNMQRIIILMLHPFVWKFTDFNMLFYINFILLFVYLLSQSIWVTSYQKLTPLDTFSLYYKKNICISVILTVSVPTQKRDFTQMFMMIAALQRKQRIHFPFRGLTSSDIV